MSEVCNNVSIEPMLQPITGEALPPSLKMLLLMAFGEASLSILSLTFECSTPVPLQIVNPSPLATGNMRILAYEQRIRKVKYGTFTPLVMSLTGGLGNATSMCYKRLASLFLLQGESTLRQHDERLLTTSLCHPMHCGATSAGGKPAYSFTPWTSSGLRYNSTRLTWTPPVFLHLMVFVPNFVLLTLGVHAQRGLR